MINKLSVEHYKAFFVKQYLEIAQPNGNPGSGLTVIVGANNVGKSSILEAIKIFTLNNPQIDIDSRHEGSKTNIKLYDDALGSLTATNSFDGSVITIEGNQQILQLNNLKYVPSRRSWKAYTANQPFDQIFYWSQMSSHDKYSADTIFVARMAKLDERERDRICMDVRSILPSVKEWRIDRSRGELFINYTTESGSRHGSDLFGEGLSSIFRIVAAVNDCVASPDDSKQLLLIDEPELSLHPQAQKALAAYLSQIAKSIQIIITTHSPYFVRWQDISNKSYIHRVSEGKSGSLIRSLSPETIKHIDKLYNDWQKPNLLDPVAREIFFSDQVVFFEGQEDIGLLRKFGEHENLRPLELFGYGVAGAGNIYKFLQLARELNIKACAVYDGDKVSDMQIAARDFPEHLIKLLPCPDIRDKHVKDGKGKDTKEIEKSGLFSNSGIIKNEYRNYLIELISEINKFMETK